MASLTRRLDSWFGVSAAESTLRREALAGATTFLAMAYIVFVNPAVLSQAGMGLQDPELYRRAWLALAQLAEDRGDAEQAALAWRNAAQIENHPVSLR